MAATEIKEEASLLDRSRYFQLLCSISTCSPLLDRIRSAVVVCTYKTTKTYNSGLQILTCALSGATSERTVSVLTVSWCILPKPLIASFTSTRAPPLSAMAIGTLLSRKMSK